MLAQLNIKPCSPGCRVLAGLTWVSPNASLDRLDLNALERWTGPRAEKQVVPFDSLQHPDWYSREKHWHPWVPQNRDGLWWYRLAPDSTFQPLDEELEAEHLEELSTMVKILRIIYSCIQPEGPRPDNAYHINGLNLSIPHQQDHACRFMLSASGYIRWLKAHRQKDVDRCFRSRLTFQDKKHMQAWGLDLPGGVGVILDLTRDRREMNVGLYLQHNIPVYYPWTLSAAADSTLYHLSPSHLLSSDGDCNTSSIPSPQVDFFFQPTAPGMRGLAVAAQKLPPLTHQVVDFQGWIPRSIQRKAAQCCFQLFYFEEHLSDRGLTQSYIRVYHRFKPHHPNPEHLTTDVCVRERWKFDHAPPAGQFYDLTTQQLKLMEATTPAPVPSQVDPSWGLMIPPLEDTGSHGSAQSKEDNRASTHSEHGIRDVAVQVNLGSCSGLDARIQNFILRLPDNFHVPYDGGLWST